MPGMRLHLTGKDRKVMEIFFSNRDYKEDSDYLKLLDTWKSTTEISTELGESWKRTRTRLEKLLGFGFLHSFSVLYNNKIIRYWAIKREGVYYILSTIDSDKLGAFLKSNKGKLKEFSAITELIQAKNVQVHYLINEIKDIVKTHQYSRLESFIEKWRADNCPLEYAYLRFFPPDRMKFLKKIYGDDEDMINKLLQTS